MIARVRGVMAASIRSGSMFWSASTSTKTGRAPRWQIVAVEATNELGGVITSSPRPTPASFSASNRASVPELRATAWPTPHSRASACSSSATSGPPTNWPEANTRATMAWILVLLGRELGREIDVGDGLLRLTPSAAA